MLRMIRLVATGKLGKTTVLNICAKALKEAGYSVRHAETPEGRELLDVDIDDQAFPQGGAK